VLVAFSLLERRTLGVALAGFVLAALGVGIRAQRDFDRRYAEDWRAVAAVLTHEARAGDVIACHVGFVARPLLRCYDGVVPVIGLAGGDLPATLARAKELRSPGGRVFLVLSHAGALDETARRAEAALGPPDEIHSQFAIRVLRFGP